jgi:hypothetical protein
MDAEDQRAFTRHRHVQRDAAIANGHEVHPALLQCTRFCGAGVEREVRWSAGLGKRADERPLSRSPIRGVR